MAGINTTKAKAEETANEQLENKLKLEDKMVQDLNTYFEQLSEDFRVIYGATGKVLTLTESYEDELKSLLKKNYRNVSKKFDSITQEALKSNIDLDLYEIIPEQESNLKDKIALAIGAYLLLRSDNITPKIARTTQDNISRITNEYIVDQARAGIAVSQAKIANEVAEKIKEWGKNHSKTIATTEVQTVAETAKHFENTEINNLVQTIDKQVGSRKVWITAGDEKVRKSHSVLDGKSIKSEELFLTGMGSLMRFAGDMEKGASLADVINCRCVVVYKYNTEIINIYRNTIFKKKGV